MSQSTNECLVYKENTYNYLVDTGSPFSVNYGSSMIGNTVNKLLPSMISDLSQELRIPVQGIVGTDQIRQYRWYYSPSDQNLSRIDDHFDLTNFQPHAIRYYLGLPVVDGQISGQARSMIIDTCSSLCYLKKSLLEGEWCDEIEEYHPNIGKFTTKGIKGDLKFLGKEKAGMIYELPAVFELVLNDRIDGLIGFSFLKDYEWVIDLKQDIWWIKA